MTLDEYLVPDMRTDAMRASLLEDRTSRTAVHYAAFASILGGGDGDDSGDIKARGLKRVGPSGRRRRRNP